MILIQQCLSQRALKDHNQQDRLAWHIFIPRPSESISTEDKGLGMRLRLATTFAHLTFEGKVGAALHLLSHQDSDGVLNFDHMIEGLPVCDILKDKPPLTQPVSSSVLLPTSACTVETHPVCCSMGHDTFSCSSSREKSWKNKAKNKHASHFTQPAWYATVTHQYG